LFPTSPHPKVDMLEPPLLVTVAFIVSFSANKIPQYRIRILPMPSTLSYDPIYGILRERRISMFPCTCIFRLTNKYCNVLYTTTNANRLFPIPKDCSFKKPSRKFIFTLPTHQNITQTDEKRGLFICVSAYVLAQLCAVQKRLNCSKCRLGCIDSCGYEELYVLKAVQIMGHF